MSFTVRHSSRVDLVVRLVVALAFAGSTLALAGTSPRLTVSGHAVHRPGPMGGQGWGKVDVDGDGRLDLVTSSNGAAALVLVYGREAGSSAIVTKQTLIKPRGSIAALATSSAGDYRLVTVSPDRRVTRYGGWPLEERGSFSVAHAVDRALIGDLDADGAPELVCAGAGRLSVYSLEDGVLEWSMLRIVTDMAFASFDADPALELVASGGDGVLGIVIDGATKAVEWSHPGGFGSSVASGTFGLSLEKGFIATGAQTPPTGYSVVPYAIDWTISNSPAERVAAGDTDADGRDEFVLMDLSYGLIRVYDAPYRQVLYSIMNLGWGSLSLGSIDFDADGRDEIWYSARAEELIGAYEKFAAAIVNPITTRPRLVIDSYRQGATATLLGDSDQDGTLELLVGTSSELGRVGLLRTLDLGAMRETWKAPNEMANSSLPFQMIYRGLHAAQLDDDPADEIVVVGGKESSDLRLLVLDGVTKDVEHQIPNPWVSWDASATHSRLVQHVPGGAPELLVASYRYAAAQNVKLSVYSLPRGELIWDGPTVGGSSDRSLGLDVGQLDDDPAQEYLLVHTHGLTAFDGATGQIEWSLPVETSGGIIVPGPLGTRVVSYRSSGEVSFYDPETQNLERSFQLRDPLETLSRLPDRDDALLAVSNERLKLIDLDGRVLAESEWLGPGSGGGDSLDVVREGSGWLVAVGRSFTTFLVRLEDNRIFADDFD